MANPGLAAYLARFNRSDTMKGPLGSLIILAVPNLTSRPSDVNGRDIPDEEEDVPGRVAPPLPVPSLNSASPPPLDAVPPLDDEDPGRRKPVNGRPLDDNGRIDNDEEEDDVELESPEDDDDAPVCGRAMDVPGLGTDAIA